ncbi:protein kinase domain-containing protein [Endozoicomonas euniceicola]|uniref:Protein kinase n=1 Tax=Endozoicomonas euniceicola TaxID=1234143 RepID=A0ABY6GYT4_9GAMM|nr:protein kinase [Endozoicomonas euniceicola]UYM17216.1 protein kinase [Endozoicomonas euniceicola]
MDTVTGFTTAPVGSEEKNAPLPAKVADLESSFKQFDVTCTPSAGAEKGEEGSGDGKSSSATPLNTRQVAVAVEGFHPFEAVNVREALKTYGLIFRNEKPLGKGGYASVEKWYDSHDKGQAVKIFKKQKDSSERQHFEKGEICALDFGTHPNLVSVHAFLLKKNDSNTYAVIKSRDTLTEAVKSDYYIAAAVYDIAPGEELFGLIGEHSLFEKNRLLRIASGVAEAIEGLHEEGIVHRDVKTENIIVNLENDDSPVKLIDYGCLKKIKNERTNSFVGTNYFFPPEVWSRVNDRSKSYGYPCDAWGLGCVLMDCMIGMAPSQYDNASQKFDPRKNRLNKMSYKKLEENTMNFAKLNDQDKKKVLVQMIRAQRHHEPDPEFMSITVELLRENEEQRLTVSEARKRLSDLLVRTESGSAAKGIVM